MAQDPKESKQADQRHIFTLLNVIKSIQISKSGIREAVL